MTGGLARLDATPKPAHSDEQAVDHYLKTHEHVPKPKVRHSKAESLKLEMECDRRRISAEHDAQQQAQVRAAREQRMSGQTDVRTARGQATSGQSNV